MDNVERLYDFLSRHPGEGFSTQFLAQHVFSDAYFAGRIAGLVGELTKRLADDMPQWFVEVVPPNDDNNFRMVTLVFDRSRSVRSV